MTRETLEKANKISVKINGLSNIKKNLEKQLVIFQKDQHDALRTEVAFFLRREGIRIGYDDIFHRDFIHFLGDLISTANQKLQKELDSL